MHTNSLQKLTQLLKKQSLKIATAESCTGGMLAQLLTMLAGSSAWFECGWVTYSNASKTALLGVSADLIVQKGAVSCEVAEAMAQGVLQKSQADFAVAITGIAGPGGGAPDKPVGTVCFGWAFNKTNQCISKRIQFGDSDREAIRKLACEEALKGACEILNFV